MRQVAAYGSADNPLVVRLRTAAVAAGTPLAEAARDGRFTLPDDVEIARELRDLLVALGDARLRLVSDHALNLLPEIEGVLPADRERLLAVVDEFLAMPPRERAEFVLGRRLGIYYSLASRRDAQRRALFESSLPARPLAQRARDARHRRRAALALHLSVTGARVRRLTAGLAARSYTPTERTTPAQAATMASCSGDAQGRSAAAVGEAPPVAGEDVAALASPHGTAHDVEVGSGGDRAP